jgi:hypothetical protein
MKKTMYNWGVWLLVLALVTSCNNPKNSEKNEILSPSAKNEIIDESF